MSSKWMNRLALVSIATMVTACGGGGAQHEGGAAPAAEPAAAEPAAAAPAAAEPAAAEPASSYVVAPVTDGGTVSGKVTITGTAPAGEEIDIPKDPNACGTKKTIVDVNAGPAGELSDAVVWLEGVASGKDWAAGDGSVDQKSCDYLPRTQAVPMGATVKIMNSDPVLHNVHAYDGAGETLFNLAQPTQGQTNDKKMTKSGPVELKCDVHAWMRAWVFVAPNPYFAVTGEDGSFSLADVPPGSYKAKVWHGTLGTKEMDVTVEAKGAATADFALAVN